MVPLSLPKYIMPSLMTGDDFVPAPVGRLHNNWGDDGNSKLVAPDRSFEPLNTGHSLLWPCEWSQTTIKSNILPINFILRYLQLICQFARGIL
jgi:hypothetical protein